MANSGQTPIGACTECRRLDCQHGHFICPCNEADPECNCRFICQCRYCLNALDPSDDTLAEIYAKVVKSIDEANDCEKINIYKMTSTSPSNSLTIIVSDYSGNTCIDIDVSNLVVTICNGYKHVYLSVADILDGTINIYKHYLLNIYKH